LCKEYERFRLEHVSFELERGSVTGFIGRNGAGKTTTLKSLLGFVHPTGGDVLFFGQRFKEHELAIKQRIGFVAGGIDYYPKKKLKTISETTSRFYDRWDAAAYARYMDMFGLDENKTSDELSAGMRVKYSLVLALSHNAELLILDEPTSGLDPVSRDSLLDVFLSLAEEGITILFSTHITSDLDACADRILYIKDGTILADTALDSFLGQYKVLDLTREQLSDELQPRLIGCKKTKHGYSALIRTSETEHVAAAVKMSDPNLESIMVHLEKE
jgi:ABC-2 type transport system ATP-binding protein